MRRYYMETRHVIDFPNDRQERSLMLNSPSEFIILDENIDMPDLEFNVSLTEDNSNKLPKNNKYRKYKEIEQEDFINYFSIALNVLEKLRWKDEEVYFVQKDHFWYEIILFSNDKTNKYYINIEVSLSLDSFYVRVYTGLRFNCRKSYRELGTIISSGQFRFLLLKTVEYLENDQSYPENAKELFNTFNLSFQGKIDPVLPRDSINFTPLIASFSNQIKQIEHRLLYNDTDPKPTRDKLRGRIEGLTDAIHEIQNFTKDLEKKSR